MNKTKRLRFPIEVILVCIRWYAAYLLSYRHIEEIMGERGVTVDHSSINRWSIRFLPMLEKVFRHHKRQVGTSWRMDETYIKVKGVCGSFNANTQFGNIFIVQSIKKAKTIDFLLTAERDKPAAMRFFDKAMLANAIPEKVTMKRLVRTKQRSINQINETMEVPMIIRQVKYHNNIVEQDHRAVKRITKPILGFK